MRESYLLHLIEDFLDIATCLHSDLTCANVCNRLFSSVHQRHPTKHIFSLATEARDYIWETVHSKSWDVVDSGYRDAFGLLSIILVLSCSAAEPVLDNFVDRKLMSSRKLAFIDAGLLLSSPRYRGDLLNLIDQDVDLKEEKCVYQSCRNCNLPKTLVDCRANPTFLSRALSKTGRGNPIAFKTSPDLVYFYDNYFIPGTAVVLGRCMDDWSAVAKWKRLEYYIEAAGDRSVPIETGASYLSSDYVQKVMSMKNFIDQFITSDSGNQAGSKQGYLAQHRLFDQIPLLMKDIVTPDYCALFAPEDEVEGNSTLSTGDPASDDIIVNAWLGPSSTVSPLHHDPYHNILAQVVGYKYVRLYHPKESQNLYPMSGRMSNNSIVDLSAADEDADRYPLSQLCEYTETVLQPGQMLFIPRWHWHFVAAISKEEALQWMNHSIDDTHPCSDLTDDGKAPSKKRTASSIEYSCDAPTCSSEDLSNNSEVKHQFSSSVSFWWGKRILKS